MKRLVLLGEGHGEKGALPVLIRRLLEQKKAEGVLYVDQHVIRDPPSHLVKWDKKKAEPDCSGWVNRVEVAARRFEIGGVLAVYDGDLATFPAGSGDPFCAKKIAQVMATAAKKAGAGKMFSLSVVFACKEYESWLIAGAESLAGRRLRDGRIVLPAGVTVPDGRAECHGKRWLEHRCPNYRPTRDQTPLTEIVDLTVVRQKKVRSFQRLENALDQLISAVANGSHISTPL